MNTEPANTLPARRLRRGAIFGVVAFAVLVLAGAGAFVYVSLQTVDVHGAVHLHDSDLAILDGNGGCAGQGGFSDLSGGAPVSVLDPAGVVLTVGRLDAGHWESDGVCRFTFSVSAPAGKGNYGLQIGHRDVIRYSENELSSALQLTIGQSG